MSGVKRKPSDTLSPPASESKKLKEDPEENHAESEPKESDFKKEEVII